MASSGRPFVKGNDPRRNAGGRPRIPPEVKEAFERLTPRAVQRLGELLESDNEPVALKAAEVVLDRRLGKVPQGVQLSGEDGGPIELSRGPDLTVHMTDAELESLESIYLTAARRANAGTDSGEEEDSGEGEG